MSEHENDPRRSGDADAEPTTPLTEQSTVGDRPADPALSTPGPVDPALSGPGPVATGPGTPAGAESAAPQAHASAPAGPDAVVPGGPQSHPGPHSHPGPPSAGQPYPGPAAHHSPWQPGHPYPAAQPHQPGHPYAAQQNQPGWMGNPSYPTQHPIPGAAPAHPTGGQPDWAGAPAGQPGWPGTPGAAPRPAPGRVGRFAALGAAALVLMAGSGVAGGFAALALDDGSGATRTYNAAPIINSADLPAIADKVQNSVVSIATGSGEGSGVVLSADGYVLTNNHVVATASGKTVEVTFADGKRVEAAIVGTDPKTDLAVVKAQGTSGLAAATFGDSDAMQVGDTVLALGSPLGLQGSVTAGIISARDRTIQAGGGEDQPTPQQRGGISSISGLLQTDAPINPGNSGGALVNTRGEVIGINTAIATAGQSNGNIGVGFAIPSNKAKAVADALRRGDRVSHPYLGVSVTRGEKGGALVSEVSEGSPAAQVGLRQGDVITRFAGKVINDSNDLVAAVQAGRVGDRVELTYTRNGMEKNATVTLAETS